MPGFWSRLDHHLFPHDYTHINQLSQYYFTPLKYTFFRILLFLLTLTIFTYVSYFFHPKDMLYFTTWGLILALLCSLIMCLQNILNWKLRSKTKLNYWKVSHFMFTITLVFQMFITGVYWGGLFPYAVLHLWGKLGLYDILNPFMAHGAPVLLLIIDLQFNLVVVWNQWYLICYYILLGVYLIMNLVYTVEVHTIYDLIDYRGWQSYLFLGACGVVIVICHFIARVFCKYCKERRVLRMLGDEEEGKELNEGERMGKELLGDVTKEIEMTDVQQQGEGEEENQVKRGEE